MNNIDKSRSAETLRPTSLSGSVWFLIILISFLGQVAWAVENNFFNLFIQDAFGASLSDVALMVSASAITATATTLFIGAWSDRVGRRKLFVAGGTLLWGASILVFAALQRISATLASDAAAAATLGITLTIVFDCVMTFFGSLANDSSFNAWITDITDATNRGRVEGINSAMPLLAMLAVFGGSMFLMIVGPGGVVTYDYPLFFEIIGGCVIVVGILTLILMKDSHPPKVERKGYLNEVFYGFRPSAIKASPRLYWVLLGFGVFATAMQVFMPYYVIYLRLPYVLGESYVFVMAPCIILAALFTMIYGRCVDRWGFTRSVIFPLILFLIGCVMLTFFVHPVGIFIGSAFMLSGYLGANACFGAEVRNNTPMDRVGLYQGLRIFMIVLIPMLIGPWIGSHISATSGADLGFGVVGDDFAPSSIMFLGGACVGALTFIVLIFIARQQRHPVAAPTDPQLRREGQDASVDSEMILPQEMDLERLVHAEDVAEKADEAYHESVRAEAETSIDAVDRLFDQSSQGSHR